MSLASTTYWIATCDACRKNFGSSYGDEQTMRDCMLKKDWQIFETDCFCDECVRRSNCISLARSEHALLEAIDSVPARIAARAK